MPKQRLRLCDSALSDEDDNVTSVNNGLILHLGLVDLKRSAVVLLINTHKHDLERFRTFTFDPLSGAFAPQPFTKTITMRRGDGPEIIKIEETAYSIVLLHLFGKADPSRMMDRCADFEISW